jgi:hypothetical protein
VKRRRGNPTTRKLDRMILWLTERRMDSLGQKEWDDWNDAIWTIRNARVEVVNAS